MCTVLSSFHESIVIFSLCSFFISYGLQLSCSVRFTGNFAVQVEVSLSDLSDSSLTLINYSDKKPNC